MNKILSKTLALSLLVVASLSVAELAKLPLLKYRSNQQSIEDLRDRLVRYQATTEKRTADWQSLQGLERRWAQEKLTFGCPEGESRGNHHQPRRRLLHGRHPQRRAGAR